MERLLGVPSMKSGEIPIGACSTCEKNGEYGSALTVACSKCDATFCSLQCSGKHVCAEPAPEPSPVIGASPSHAPVMLHKSKAPKELKLYEERSEEGSEESLEGGPERLRGVPAMKAAFAPRIVATPGGRRSSRGESLGGDMERLLGVPSMKSGRVPSGSCSVCEKRGVHGKELTVSCSKCKATFCNLDCSGKHECPKAGGVLGIFKKKKSPSPVRNVNSMK